MPAFYRIKNWEIHQHYKDRSPPWIKLHRELLTSETWITLADASRVLAIACMLVAAATGNKIPTNPAYIKRVAYLNQDPDFTPLLALQFIEETDENGNVLASASKKLAKRTKRLPRGETEERRDRDRGEENMSGASAPDDVPLKKVSRKEEAAEVLQFLNLKANRAFEPTDTNLDFILARFKEGYTASQCRKVIVRKCRSWLDDEKMSSYLRPATLFNREKFNQYVGELVVAEPPPSGGFLSEVEVEHGAAH